MALYRDEPSQREVEVRSGAVTLGMEQGNLVHFSYRQSEVRRHGRVNGERARNRGMEASQIEGQASIDEDPDIVIARERQRFATFELEPRADFARESEVVPGARLFGSRDPALVVHGEKLRIGEIVGVVGLFGERQLREDFDVDAGHLVVPLVEIAGVCRLLSKRTRADQRSLADPGVSRFSVRCEHDGDQPWRLHTAAEYLEVRMTNAAIDGQRNDIAERDGHIERIGKRAGHDRASEARFDLARGRASVAIGAVSIVASFVVARQNEAIAARRRTGSHAAIGLDLAIRIAPVSNDVIAVIASFVALFESVVAHREVAGHAHARAFVPRFTLAGIRATIARNGRRATIFAFFVAGNDPVATRRSGAGNAWNTTDPAILQLACGRAAVVALESPVVAGFLTRDDTVAANDRGYARFSGLGASEILFYRSAVGRTAVARIVIAVIAYLTWLDEAISAAGGVSAALAALTCPAAGRRAAPGEHESSLAA